MSRHRYWFQHGKLSHTEWMDIVEGMTWMLEKCPEAFSLEDGGTSPATLRGSLHSAHYVLTDNGGEVTNIMPLEHDGTTPPIGEVYDTAAIVLNGNGKLGADYFVLGAHATGKPQVIDTEGKPYELMVVATLMLAAHQQPEKWTISSEAPLAIWQAARDFMKGYVPDIQIPQNIQAQWDQATSVPTLNPPALLDFRA